MTRLQLPLVTNKFVPKDFGQVLAPITASSAPLAHIVLLELRLHVALENGPLPVLVPAMSMHLVQRK